MMNSFLRGLCSVFDLSGLFSRNREHARKILSKTPEQAVLEDWTAVGNDLRRAMGQPALVFRCYFCHDELKPGEACPCPESQQARADTIIEGR